MHEEGAGIKNNLHYAFAYLFSFCQKLVQSSEKLFLKWVTITSRNLLDWRRLVGTGDRSFQKVCAEALTHKRRKG